MSEKTELPTPQKLREARAQGQVPRSRLFTSGLVSCAALAALGLTAPRSALRLRALCTHLLSAPELRSGAALEEALAALAACALPVLGAALAAALAGGLLCAGFELHLELLAPKAERLDPFAGLARLFGTKQLKEVARALLVAAVVAAVFWLGVREQLPQALQAIRLDGVAALGATLALLRPALLRAGAVLLALGVADFLLARARLRKELMMSRQEVKQEHKNSDGDPHQKQKRRAVHRQLAQGGPARGVQKATAIVVNPTHIAIALRYRPEECEAPYLVAKGREEDALQLRREAQALGIPIIKDVPLARALVHYDVGEEVPDELYRAAAAVLRVALELQDADPHPGSETP